MAYATITLLTDHRHDAAEVAADFMTTFAKLKPVQTGPLSFTLEKKLSKRAFNIFSSNTAVGAHYAAI